MEGDIWGLVVSVDLKDKTEAYRVSEELMGPSPHLDSCCLPHLLLLWRL